MFQPEFLASVYSPSPSLFSPSGNSASGRDRDRHGHWQETHTPDGHSPSSFSSPKTQLAPPLPRRRKICLLLSQTIPPSSSCLPSPPPSHCRLCAARRSSARQSSPSSTPAARASSGLDGRSECQTVQATMALLITGGSPHVNHNQSHIERYAHSLGSLRRAKPDPLPTCNVPDHEAVQL